MTTVEMTVSRKRLQSVLEREYPVTLVKDEGGGYVAELCDLPGCITVGETVREALANLSSARVLWLKTAFERGDEIPLPSTDETYSGKILVRMPRSLHRRLAERADHEGVSLNQLVITVLAHGLGERGHSPGSTYATRPAASSVSCVSEGPPRRR